MVISKFSKFWTLVTFFLIVIIITGGLVAWSQYSRSQPVEISISNLPSREELNYIYIDGAVTSPGFYSLRVGDSVETLIQAAGGTTSSADSRRLKLYMPMVGEENQPQKVNINWAEVWLLEALPGIGEIRAKAIVDYRRQEGLFRNINELTKVEGIGITTYEKIKNLIAVAD